MPKKRGRYVPVWSLHVKSKGKNLELTFRIPAEAAGEIFPHIERFVKKTKNVKRPKDEQRGG
jgi:hypothetical protein